jgi:hypothetical protein
MPDVFRWDITRREQLGRLVLDDEPDPWFATILGEVRHCCARVIAMAGDARLVFLGRSPESLYDYLASALARTSWADRCTLLNISLKGSDCAWTDLGSAPREAFREQFRACDLDPAAIAASERPIALVDLIYGGETFGKLTALLFAWAATERVDDRALRRRLRIVGITERHDGSPKSWRWRRLDWAKQFPPRALKGVSIPPWFWSRLGDSEQKVSRSNPPARWADPEMARPPRGPQHAEGLRLAVALHNAGRSSAERDALAGTIAGQPAIRHRWCRTLVSELRSAARPRRIERSFGSKWRVRSPNHLHARYR